MFKGTIISQIIGIIGTLILAKLYGSEAYGIFGVYFSIASILAVLNTLQLENAIIITPNKKQGLNLANSLFFISIFISQIVLLFSFILKNYFSSSSFNFNLLLISIFGSILLSFNKVHETSFTYLKKFEYISISKILFSLFNLSFQFILFFHYKIIGLVVGNVISLLLVCVFFFFKQHSFSLKIDLTSLKTIIQSNISIVKYILPSSIINSLAINLIPILLLTFFSVKDSGVYFLSLKILSIPLFLISTSVSNVYFEKSTKILEYSKHKLFKFTKNIVFSNILIMVVALLLINTIGIYLLEVFFNKNWENLRLFTFILSFLILSRSSFNPISSIIIVLKKNHIALTFNFYMLLTTIFSILIGNFLHNIALSIILFSIFGSLGYIFLLLYFLKELKNLKTNYEKTNAQR